MSLYLDSHQHFWYYNVSEYPWITDQMDSLKKNFLPENIDPLLKSINFSGTIAVQARQTTAETEWLLKLAGQHDFIMGVVGWVDLCSPQVQQQLEKYSQYHKLKGVRHVVQDEPDNDFMLRSDFLEGIRLLDEFNLTYDLLIYPTQLPAASKLVQKFPNQSFVVDHIAKPDIKHQSIQPWEKQLRQLAASDNVYCKLSGMVTEADWSLWHRKEFEPYLNIVMDAFGFDRVMIGSDWPVCTVCGSYAAIMNIIVDFIKQYPDEYQRKILGQNCATFYGIRI